MAEGIDPTARARVLPVAVSTTSEVTSRSDGNADQGVRGWDGDGLGDLGHRLVRSLTRSPFSRRHASASLVPGMSSTSIGRSVISAHSRAL